MATGGVFQLITNDGKQDRMLMATQMLRNRLEAIRAKRRADPSIQDETPTLLDIERTHVLFTNAHFKPFVALGYEYNKVNTGAGTVQLGSSIQFSIPQFGDFFNDMVLYVQLAAPVLTTIDTGANAPTVKWCDYPGERLLKKVSFEVNGNPLDQYTLDASVMARQFKVQPGKERGYNRCMGQQETLSGWMNPDVSGSPDSSRVVMSVTNGAQTPKASQTGLTMLIPLQFWCNTDPRLAVPSVAIPYGQRFINIDLASASEMLGFQLRGAGLLGNTSLSVPAISQMNLYINNIFVNPEIHKIFIKRIGFTLIRVHRQQNIATSLSNQQILLQNLKWPIETLFVGLRPTVQPDPLRDWWKFTQVTETAMNMPNLPNYRGTTMQTGVASFTQAFPYAAGAQTLTVSGVTPVSPATSVTATYSLPGGEPAAGAIQLVTIAGAGTGAYGYFPYPGAVAAARTVLVTVVTPASTQNVVPAWSQAQLTALVNTKTIDTITISAHGIFLYNQIPADFFNAYTPFTYGGPHIRTPEDQGALMIPFNLYPGTYQPSSHVNVSRAREFYIEYFSSVIGFPTNSPASGTLVVVASAINFLLISDGSAVLRYST